MKEKILKLREEGRNYNEIVEILGCAKSTVSYHCGEGQKEKTRLRGASSRSKKVNIINKKIGRFTRDKIRNFKKGTRGGKTDSDFDYNSAFEQISSVKNCYLSGRPINLEDSKSYHLDHIMAFSKGGENSLENLGVACKEANMAKNDLSVEDFIQLCIDVCKHNGYAVK